MKPKRKAKPAAKKSPAKKKTPAQPKLDAAVMDALKNSKASRELAEDIAEKESDLSAAETAVANATAARKKAMEHRNEVDKELKNLHKDLAKLALGGFSERLPFREAAAAKKGAALVQQPTETTSGPATVANPENVTNGKPAADSDAWRSLKLAEMGLADKRALSALQAAGIETFGDAEDRLASNKPIPNFGDGARQKYDDAKVTYFTANPVPANKPNGKQTAQNGKPGEASRGAAVDREKKALTDTVDNVLAFSSQPVTPENGTKVLAIIIGTDPVRALESATLEQLAAWQLKARNIDPGEVVQAVRSSHALN